MGSIAKWRGGKLTAGEQRDRVSRRTGYVRVVLLLIGVDYINPKYCFEKRLVPLAGIEPALLAELDFESSASTNSATGAFGSPP
jgi:hypothetical protein